MAVKLQLMVVVLGVFMLFSNWAEAACTHTVIVSTVAQLYNAVKSAQNGDCIEIVDGTYQLNENSPLDFEGVNNVVLMSASNDPTRVTIQGVGFVDDGSAGAGCSPYPGDSNNDCLWISNTLACNSLTISAITFTMACYGIKVDSYTGPTDIEILNCRFIDMGYRCIKGTWGGSYAVHATKGLVQNCYFEDNMIPPACWFSSGDYIAGFDLMILDSWTFQDNTFLNIKGHNSGGRACYQLWNGCQNCIVQRNRCLGCDRFASLGNGPEGSSWNCQNISVINNYISLPANDGIELDYTTNCNIYNNSIYADPAHTIRGIYAVPSGKPNTNDNIENNLISDCVSPANDLAIAGVTGTISNNVTGINPAIYWSNPSAGILDLTQFASNAIGTGVTLAMVPQDIYNQNRHNPSPCVGANEFFNYTPTQTGTKTPSPTVTATPLPTHTASPTGTACALCTATPTNCAICTATNTPTCQVLADYDSGADPTSSGGTTTMNPSGYDSASNTTTTGTATYDPTQNYGTPSGDAMNLSWNMQTNGWAIYYQTVGGIQDWTNFIVLSFWVKGNAGGERFHVQLRDCCGGSPGCCNQEWSAVETATNQWTQIVLTLPTDFSLHGAQPVSWNHISDVALVFDSSQLGPHTLWIDDMMVCSGMPPTATPTPAAPTATATPPGPTATATSSYTATVTATPAGPTSTFTVTLTPSLTLTSSETFTITQTWTPVTGTPTNTFTASGTPTCTLTVTPTQPAFTATPLRSSTFTTTFTYTLTPTAYQSLNIIQLLTYPNPVKKQNTVNFYINLGDIPDRIDIKVYTTAARLIKVMTSAQTKALNGVTLVKDINNACTYAYAIPYDLKDYEGSLLADGLYYFVVEAKKNDISVRSIGRFTVLR